MIKHRDVNSLMVTIPEELLELYKSREESFRYELLHLKEENRKLHKFKFYLGVTVIILSLVIIFNMK